MAYTGLVRQLDQNAVPCPLSFGSPRPPAHPDREESLVYMELFREEATIAETALISNGAVSMQVESWYFKCPKCHLILPARRGDF